MTLERKIAYERIIENPLKEKLNKVDQEFNAEMRNVFGARLTNNDVEPNNIITPELIVGLIQKGKDTLEQQKQLLEEAGRITDATAVEVVGNTDELTLVDFERAIEFLTGTRKNGDSMHKIWNILTKDASTDLERISPMPYPKPSVLFPRRINRMIFSNEDRGLWKAHRKEMDKVTRAQIATANDLVNQTWFTDNQNG